MQCNVYQSFSNVDFVCMTLNNWLQFKEGRGNQFQASTLLLLFYSIVKIKIREQPFDLCELSRGSSQGLEKNLIGRFFHNWCVRPTFCKTIGFSVATGYSFWDRLHNFFTQIYMNCFQFISWTNWVNSGKFLDNCWISCQVMADMEKKIKTIS